MNGSQQGCRPRSLRRRAVADAPTWGRPLFRGSPDSRVSCGPDEYVSPSFEWHFCWSTSGAVVPIWGPQVYPRVSGELSTSQNRTVRQEGSTVCGVRGYGREGRRVPPAARLQGCRGLCPSLRKNRPWWRRSAHSLRGARRGERGPPSWPPAASTSRSLLTSCPSRKARPRHGPRPRGRCVRAGRRREGGRVGARSRASS